MGELEEKVKARNRLNSQKESRPTHNAMCPNLSRGQGDIRNASEMQMLSWRLDDSTVGQSEHTEAHIQLLCGCSIWKSRSREEIGFTTFITTFGGQIGKVLK